MLRESPVTSWNHVEKTPRVHELAYIDQNAILIGEVIVDKKAVILPGVIIRGDEGCPIVVGEATNVQDGVIMHALKGSGIDIGKHCSIAHGAVVHGPCEIGDHCFIGFNAVLLKAKLGKNCFVSHGALVLGVEVPDRKIIPPGQLIDTKEKVLALDEIKPEMASFAEEVLEVNEELLKGYHRIAVRKNLEVADENSPHLIALNE